MANRTNCLKCGRGIDEFARVCPYCNWEQSQPVPAAATAAPVEYKPPIDARARNSIIGVIAFGFLLMVAFAFGAFFHGPEPARAAQQSAAQTAPGAATPHSTVTLVPMTDGATLADDAPATSLPAQGTNASPGTNDVTALPSEQYTAAAARATATQQQQPTGNVIDPRSLTGSPYSESPADSAPPRPASRPRPTVLRAVETQPIPLYQPVPHVRVFREETAQLALIVGTDGRVHDIDIRRNVPEVMGPLIGSVQQWRFRPATQNGQPVSARFSVAVTFKP